jgi:SAM-dependent methyltransferase
MNWSNAVLNLPTTKHAVKAVALRFGYNPRHWARYVMYQHCVALISAMGPTDLSVLEISPGHDIMPLPFKSYTTVQYPEFDICEDTLPETFDLIIADQVFEHVVRPWSAVKNVHRMLKDGGAFLIMTPFLIKMHATPIDCSRWTETGLKYLLNEGGFDIDKIQTWSWGNRACVKSNLERWTAMGFNVFRPLNNERDYPVVIWALAYK